MLHYCTRGGRRSGDAACEPSALLASGGVTCWGNNQGQAFSDALPAEPGQTAHALPGVEGADAVFVGGVHTCTLRAGVATCRGNDWSGAVRGAAAGR